PIGVRQAAVGEPEVLVEAGGADDERIVFPVADRAAVVKRIVVVAAHLALLLAAVEIDDPIVAVAGADEHEDALPRAILRELDAVRRLVLPNAARRLAVQEHRVVAQLPALAVPIDAERPRLKRRHAARLPRVREQPRLVHRDVRALLGEHGGGRITPVAAEQIAGEAWSAVRETR